MRFVQVVSWTSEFSWDCVSILRAIFIVPIIWNNEIKLVKTCLSSCKKMLERVFSLILKNRLIVPARYTKFKNVIFLVENNCFYNVLMKQKRGRGGAREWDYSPPHRGTLASLIGENLVIRQGNSSRKFAYFWRIRYYVKNNFKVTFYVKVTLKLLFTYFNH